MILDKLQFFMILVGLVVATVVFVALFFVSAPYGRHARRGWGPLIPNHISWFIMETPAVIMFALFFAVGTAPKNLPILLFFALWELHYVHRAFIYPWTIQDGHKKMPIVVILMGFGFNLGNAYANRRFLFTLSGGYSLSWLYDSRFLVGVTLFLVGFIINRWADLTLCALRKPGEVNYSIPYSGLFNWFPAPITWVKLLSGLAGRWQPGHCQAWHLQCGPLLTLPRAPAPIMPGIMSTSPNIRRIARH
ncbi:MAG: hypothetical protein WAV05_03920 [Anaerolineales bacterium]